LYISATTGSYHLVGDWALLPDAIGNNPRKKRELAPQTFIVQNSMTFRFRFFGSETREPGKYLNHGSNETIHFSVPVLQAQGVSQASRGSELNDIGEELIDDSHEIEYRILDRWSKEEASTDAANTLEALLPALSEKLRPSGRPVNQNYDEGEDIGEGTSGIGGI
jgi:hypothetical protein